MSLTPEYSYLFLVILFLFHPEASIGVPEKNLFEFLEELFHKCFEKIATPKISGNFPLKHPW